MTAPNELSFLPEDYLEQKYKRRANIICGILIAATAGGIGFSYSRTHARNARVEASFATVDAKYVDAARKIEQVKKIDQEQGEVAHHAELAASLVEKVPRSNILAEITNSLPTGVSLLEFSLHATPQGTQISAPSYGQRKPQPQSTDNQGLAAKPLVYDTKIKITGIAENDVQVAQLMTSLSRSSLFSDVNLVVTDTYTEHQDAQQDAKTQQLRKFQIEMSLNPNAEVRDDTNTAAVELSK